MAKQNQDRQQSEPNIWIEGLQTIGLSIILALGIRQFVAEARYIPTGSMKPTLQVNDRLVVEKISYRLKPPTRGDIIVFWPPAEATPENQPRNAFIKRIVGLPGDRVEVVNGKVFINNQPMDEDYIQAPPTYRWGPKMVPENNYIVFGDNRNDSRDSHAWPQPFLPEEQIIGRAFVRFWPLHRMGLLHRD